MRSISLIAASAAWVWALHSSVDSRQIPVEASRNIIHDLQGTSESSTVRLSWQGLRVNAPPGDHELPQYLTLSTAEKAELDPRTAVLHFTLYNRTWEDVTLRCGVHGGLENCRTADLASPPFMKTGQGCQAAHATQDGRALFDPQRPGCQELAALWQQQSQASAHDAEIRVERLLSLVVGLHIERQPTARRQEAYTHTFWLGHLYRSTAAWPISNAGWMRNNASSHTSKEREWHDGGMPDRITSLFSDPFLPRAENPSSSDPFNGVDVNSARYNLGLSLHLPPQEANQSSLLPVHAPVTGQVVYVDRYRRPNPPSDSSLNDELSWDIAIRDHWGFVWHLLGISPYHQHVYVGQEISEGKVVGHASLRPLADSEPRDKQKPIDPPEKPPGGDGNPRYPFWFRELRIGVSRPPSSWSEWKGPYDDIAKGEEGWTWYDPLAMLKDGPKSQRSYNLPPPPFLATTSVFFADPSAYPPRPPRVIAAAPLTDEPARRGDDNEGDVVAEVSGSVDLMVQVDTFAATPHLTGGPATSQSAQSLDPVSLYQLEWALLPASSDPHLANGADCAGIKVNALFWRPDSRRIETVSPSASPYGLWERYVAAFTTGNFPWTRRRYASQFDWKGRSIFYRLGTWETRRDAIGGPISEESAGAGVGRQTELQQEPGLYRVVVKARSAWGTENCWRTNGLVKVKL